MSTQQEQFVTKYAQAAVAAGHRFRMNPLVILAQAAHESAWGTSYSARARHNLFGMVATSGTSEFWHGKADKSVVPPYLTFRVYDTDTASLSDFARLIANRPAYQAAFALSQSPAQYAAAIAASPYITEVNGDNRPAYARAVATNAVTIAAIAQRLKIQLT